MSDCFIFTLAVLATFRVSLMFSRESGPGYIFRTLRQRPRFRSSLREGMSCLACQSIWWGAVATLALAGMGEVPWRFVPFYWLAVSAGAVVIHQTWTRGDL